MIRRALGLLGKALFFLVILLLLAVQIVPPLLDRIYYRGPKGDHFDGARFFNPDGEDTVAPPGGGSRAGLMFNQLTGADGRPPWPASVPVTPSKPAPRVWGDAMVATWVGHATMLVQTRGLNILTDPIWSDRTGPLGLGVRRVAAPGIRFEDLPPIDLVLVSHDHYDHMDLATLKRLWDRDHPRIVTSPGNDTLLKGAGIDQVSVLDWGWRTGPRDDLDLGCEEGTETCPVRYGVAVTRSHHWSSRWSTDRNRALWSSFVVTLPGGNIFFAGDTGPGDLAWPEEAKKWGPIRLAILPIGAFRFVPGQMVIPSHIGPVDAAEAFARLGAPTTIPIHWGTFRLSYEAYDTPPKLLAAVMKCRPDIGGHFAPVAIGRPVAIPPLAPPVAPSVAKVSREQVIRCLDTPAVKALR